MTNPSPLAFIEACSTLFSTFIAVDGKYAELQFAREDLASFQIITSACPNMTGINLGLFPSGIDWNPDSIDHDFVPGMPSKCFDLVANVHQAGNIPAGQADCSRERSHQKRVFSAISFASLQDVVDVEWFSRIVVLDKFRDKLDQFLSFLTIIGGIAQWPFELERLPQDPSRGTLRYLSKILGSLPLLPSLEANRGQRIRLPSLILRHSQPIASGLTQ